MKKLKDFLKTAAALRKDKNDKNGKFSSYAV